MNYWIEIETIFCENIKAWRGVKSEIVCHKIAIKHEKGDSLDFLTTPKYPFWKNLYFQLSIQLTVGFSDEGGDIAGQDEADLGDQVTRVDEPGDERKGQRAASGWRQPWNLRIQNMRYWKTTIIKICNKVWNIDSIWVTELIICIRNFVWLTCRIRWLKRVLFDCGMIHEITIINFLDLALRTCLLLFKHFDLI